jgi:hypothetical protein
VLYIAKRWNYPPTICLLSFNVAFHKLFLVRPPCAGGKGGNRSGGFDGGDFSRAFLDPFNYGHDHGNWRGGKVVKNAGGGRRQVILNTGAGVGNQFGAKTVRDRGRMGLGGNHSGPIDGSRNVRGGHLHDSHDPHFSSGGRAGRRGGRIGQRGGPRRNLKGEKGHAAASADDLNDELDRFFQRVRLWDGRSTGAHPVSVLEFPCCCRLWHPHRDVWAGFWRHRR